MKKIEIGLRIVFLVLIVLMFFIIKDNRDCISNPFTYGADKISHENNNVYCNCYFDNPSSNTFSFNKKEIFMGPTNSIRLK